MNFKELEDLTNILAGLGIGGLAFALAAKETVSNLFGSFTVVLDKPFQIGDWVRIGGEVEGVVEEVGFRSTRVRTFYDSLVTLPNNKLNNVNVDNFGKRTYRRYKTSFALTYDTPPDKIEAFCEAVRYLIDINPKTRKDYYNVYLNNLNEYSLDIIVYFFWEVGSWSEELAERHSFLLNVINLAKELKIDFAFPTRTNHQIPDEMPSHRVIKDPHVKAEVSANKVLKDNISKDFSEIKGTNQEGGEGEG